MRLVTGALAAVALFAAAAPAYAHRDRDHNPPGWRGGPGTNWENPPGRRGGPGASPDRRWYGYAHPHRHHYWHGAYWSPARACWWRDRDGNPPGPAGGRGTNWENPPGPSGGPGASPDRNLCR
ncbi:MAG: hypothetical protein K2P58_09735 [Hyphomonadaceae bacterium]|nr:hypothetical protein [Hyphomonadaceae bacterium]